MRFDKPHRKNLYANQKTPRFQLASMELTDKTEVFGGQGCGERIVLIYSKIVWNTIVWHDFMFKAASHPKLLGVGKFN